MHQNKFKKLWHLAFELICNTILNDYFHSLLNNSKGKGIKQNIGLIEMLWKLKYLQDMNSQCY